MKRYVLVLLFNKEGSEILLMKRKKNPYKGLYNGIGGKIEEGETIYEACLRETHEEINIKLENPKLLMTNIYPSYDENPQNKIELNIFYDFINKVNPEENDEGSYEFKDIKFALDFENKELAGLANVAMFVREILVKENIIKFY